MRLTVSSRNEWPSDWWFAVDDDDTLLMRFSPSMGVAVSHPPTRRRRCGIEGWCVYFRLRDVTSPSLAAHEVVLRCRNARRLKRQSKEDHDCG